MLELRSDGFYYGKEKIDDISIFMNYALEIKSKVTLEDLFNILISFDVDGTEDINYLFNSYTRGYDIKKYYEELNKETTEEINLIYLMASWATDYCIYEDDDCVEHSELNDYISISGIDNKDEYYSISLTPLNELKDVILKIDNNYEIISFNDGKTKTLFKSKKDISVGEFIGGILYEISFHGYPDDKEVFLDSLNETVDMVDSGDMELIPHEEVILPYLEKELKRLVKEEKYEKAAKVQKEIDECKQKQSKNLD